MDREERKYNNGKPIRIQDLNPEEIENAIHEWAEGSESLEKLLKECYKNGIYSYACCTGGGGKHCKTPYVSYELYDDKSIKSALYIAQKLKESKMNCDISFYGDEWFRKQFPDSPIEFRIETLVENRDEVFEKMLEVLGELEKVDLDKIEISDEAYKKAEQTLKFEDLVKKALKDYPEMFENQAMPEVDGVFIKDKSDLENVEWNLEDWD